MQQDGDKIISIAVGSDGIWAISKSNYYFYFSPWQKCDEREDFGILANVAGKDHAACLIETGYYFGGGNSGAEEPTELNFNIVPEIVFITGPITADIIGTVALSPYSHSCWIVHSVLDEAFSSDQLHVSFSKIRGEKYNEPNISRVSWFSFAGSSLAQLDALDAMYHYVAIGKLYE
jgi:hypothetical protein